MISFILECIELLISLDLLKLTDCSLRVEISLWTLESVNKIFSNDSSKVLEASIVILTPFSTTSLLVSEFLRTASVSVLMSLIKLDISVVFCLVISASFLISSATTAKPFPCSPALAASMAAFRARRLVWLAILLIILVILLISL